MRRSLFALQKRATASPYVVLGLSPNASLDEVRKRYRDLARECHPDVPSTGSAHRFREVTAAYYLIKGERNGTSSKRPSSSEYQTEHRSGRTQHSSSSTTMNESEEKLRQAASGKQKMYNRSQWFVHQELWNRDGYEYLCMATSAFFLGLWTVDYWCSQSQQVRVEDLSRMASAQRPKETFQPQSQPAPRGTPRAQAASVAQPSPPIATTAADTGRPSTSSDTLVQSNPLSFLRKELTKSRRQRFSDVKEFLYEYDPDGVDVRRVTTQRFPSELLQESSVTAQCVHHTTIHSDDPNRSLAAKLDPLLDGMEKTKWAHVDAPAAGMLALAMLSSVPVLSPNSAKWTLVEYRPTTTNTLTRSTECVAAIRNLKYAGDTAGPVQRIVIGGHDELQAAALLAQELDLASGKIRQKDLVHGGVVKMHDKRSFRGNLAQSL